MYLCILYYIYTYIYIYMICTNIHMYTGEYKTIYIYVYIHIKHIHTHINSLYIYIYVYPLYISYIYIYIGCIILWCEYYDMIPEIISAPLRSQVLPVHAPQNGISSESKPRQPGTPRGSGPEPRENHGETMGKWWLIWLNGIWIWPCGQSLHNYMILYGKIHHFLMGNSHYFYGHFP